MRYVVGLPGAGADVGVQAGRGGTGADAAYSLQYDAAGRVSNP